MTTLHVSALTLDALALGALDASREAEVRGHLASCARCRTAHQVAAERQQHFVAHVLPRTMPSARRRSWQWAWLAVPALAAIALVLVTVRDRDGHHQDLGIKGDAALQVFAKRGDETFAVRDRTTLAAGDRIRFVVTANGTRFVMIVSVDGAGAASIYYPYGGSQSERVADERHELPGSIVLDAAPGPERLFAIFSDDPIGAEVVKERLRAIAAGGADAIRRVHALDVPSRAQVSLVFEKAAP